MTDITIQNRKRGACFWGLATGDALGAPQSFTQEMSLKVVDMISGGKSKLLLGLGQTIRLWLFA